ncbi:MAG: MAPEG family protein [Sphingomonadaceae bacterium]
MIISWIAGGLLGLILLALSLMVSFRRRAAGITLGDGGDAILIARMRAQANFVEYAPLTLLLLFLAEQTTSSRWLPAVAAALLIAGRVLHPIGLGRPAFVTFRMLGMIGTWSALAMLSAWLLVAGIRLA